MIDFNDAPPQLRVVDPVDEERRLERLRTELRQRSRQIVAAIFPLARVHGSDARIGSVQGEAGESLSIGLDGERAGLWIDHATGEGGDLITLWMATIGSNHFGSAVTEMEDYLGLGSSRPKFSTRVHHVATERQDQARKAPRSNVVLPAASATYHYLAPDGVTILAIVRRYDLDEIDKTTGKTKKTFRPQKPDGSAGMPDVRPLYRLPQLVSASQVVLVEGEKCADALDTLGIAATSQMGGAKADPAKTDWSPLAGKIVTVWQDNDDAGSGLLESVREALTGIGCTIRSFRIPAGKPKGWDAADAVDEGLDLPALLAQPSAAARTRRKMRFLTLEEMEAQKPPEWLIRDHVPASSFVSLYGPHGSMKSFVALDWAMCIAHGQPWLGTHDVKAGRVVYVAGEGQHGFGKRAQGWRVARSLSGSIPFHVLPQSVAMPTNELDELLDLISDLPSPPALVVLDTLARTFGAGDENSQKDMNAFVAGCDRLRETTGACVLVIHHSGKDQDKGSRGSTALPGAVDTNILVRRKGDAIILVNKAPYGKQKDAAEFEDLPLRGQLVKFSYQGADASTLVMMPDEAVMKEPAERVERVGSNQKKVLEALEKAARQGRALGLTSLKAMVEIDNGTLSKVLETLCEKGQITALTGEPRTWTFA